MEAIWQYVAKGLKNKYVKFDPEMGIYPKEIVKWTKIEYTKIFNAALYITIIDTITGKNQMNKGLVI